MKTKLFLLCVLITLSLGSCSNDDDNPPKQDSDTFEPTPIIPTLIAEGDLNANETLAQARKVITEQSEWDSLKTQMEPISTSFDDSNLDFSESMVLAVFTEIKNYNTAIAIDSIVEHQDEIKVFVGDPVPGILPTLSVGYSIVKIPKSEKPVEFQ